MGSDTATPPTALVLGRRLFRILAESTLLPNELVSFGEGAHIWQNSLYPPTRNFSFFFLNVSYRQPRVVVVVVGKLSLRKAGRCPRSRGHWAANVQD